MITKREFYKKLKEKKLFSRYCIVVATAFHDNQNPRAELIDYEIGWLNEQWTNIYDIKDWWIDKLIILQQ